MWKIPSSIILIILLFQESYAIKLNEDCFTNHRNKFLNIMQKDGEFRIIIRDLYGRMADRFEPGKDYKISLRNDMYGMNFKSFSLFTSLSDEESMKMDEVKMHSTENVGNFVISKKYGTTDELCPNSIYNSNRRFLTKVEAIWQAPSKPVKCVKFLAQVVKDDYMIFENTGGLLKKFCPTKIYKSMKMDGKLMEDDYMEAEMPPMVKECCACGVASYKVTFQGLWTKRTHPKDWPKQKSMLHWTNLIGATHTGNYFIYFNGGQASQAVQSICSYGDNTVLKQQFAEESIKPNLKSYFNTSGMWNENELDRSRSGFISVNRTHHLFSFLTMMGPSPDWCTGVAAVDFCTIDCSWKDNFTMDLYPFDAGIKHGYTYLPENSDRLDIPDPIRVINSTVMKEYPFTPNSPVARISYQKIKPKNNWECTKMAAGEVREFDDMNSNKNPTLQFDGGSLIKKRRNVNKKSPLDDPALANMATFLCLTSQWTAWTPCSVTCGIGTEMRSRIMLKNAKAELCIHLPLHESRTCEGRKRACDFSAPCSLLTWSRWSPCNATCEQSGYKLRSRMFARLEEKESCLKKYGKTLNIEEQEICKKQFSMCDPIIICSEGMVMGSKCGKPSTNYYYDASKHLCTSFKYLGCKGSLNNFPTKELCEKQCIDAVNALPQWRKDRMAHLQYQSQSSSEKRNKTPSIPDQCLLEVNYGSMTCGDDVVKEIKYYYNHRNGRCRQFKYSGCNGNSNKFPSYTACIKACMPEQLEFIKKAVVKPCQVSQWSHWGPCSTRCGVGEQTRWRSVLKPAMNGGTPCPDLFSSKVCVKGMC